MKKTTWPFCIYSVFIRFSRFIILLSDAKFFFFFFPFAVTRFSTAERRREKRKNQNNRRRAALKSCKTRVSRTRVLDCVCCSSLAPANNAVRAWVRSRPKSTRAAIKRSGDSNIILCAGNRFYRSSGQTGCLDIRGASVRHSHVIRTQLWIFASDRSRRFSARTLWPNTTSDIHVTTKLWFRCGHRFLRVISYCFRVFAF